MSATLSTNSIAFIGLCNEYRMLLEHAMEMERRDFIAEALRLLPRMYISAADLSSDADEYDSYIENALDEDYYDSIRRSVESLMGPDDMYLEVFEDDMKYSDTPIAVSLSEGLTDIFQVVYNFLSMLKDAPDVIIASSIAAMKDDFESYWSQILCNTLRALNHLRYNGGEEY